MSDKPTSTATHSASAAESAKPTTEAKTAAPKKALITEELVCDWLSRHPDFLLRHDALLTALELPDRSGGAISLHQRQLRVLRDSNNELEQRLRQIVGNAKYAQSVSRRLFELAVALLANRADSRLDWIDLVREHFELARVTVWMADSSGESTFAVLKAWLDNHGARCDEQPEADWLQEVFGSGAAELKSVAAVAIRGESAQGAPDKAHEVLGVLVLGAADAERFHSSMAVEALEQLGELLFPLLQLKA